MSIEDKKTKLIAVVAMDEGRVIGNKGDLPWHLPQDLKWFKKVTMGFPIIMGRKTFESIGRALPGRRNVVLSRDENLVLPDGVEVFNTTDSLLKEDIGEKAYLIGGEAIFKALLPFCEEVLLGLVSGNHAGDTWFPEFEAEFAEPEELQSDEEITHFRYVRK